LDTGVYIKVKTNMKIEEIRKIGFEVLSKSLGPDGMIRFLQQFDSGSDDYTKNRYKWLRNYSIDKIYSELKK
jgi:hypothetical protein